ncbi:MAG TPA: amino acid permease [Gemmatimonadales bacterium]|nr:amino acid permease [Gemmatimonadales bacterium]
MQPLQRALRSFDATTIVIGSMIGSGIFITSAESARLVSAPGWLLLAWGLAGLLTISGALTCAELAAAYPRAGGQYVFLRDAYGPGVGFLFGWAMFTVIQSGTIAAVAVAFASFLGVLIPGIAPTRFIVAPVALGSSGYALSLSTEQLAALLSILVLTIANTRGLKQGVRVQNLSTIAKVAALAGLIVVGLALGDHAGSAARTSSWWNPAANGAKEAGTLALFMLLGRAMVGPLFAQSAWNNVTFAGAEVENPGRNLPRALLIGCGTVVGLYLLANLAYVTVLPLGAIQHAPNNRVAVSLMQAILGPVGGVIMAAVIVISTFGCNNGLILSGARVYYAMARDGLFFSKAGIVNSRAVPAVALTFQGVWAALLTLPRTVGSTPGGSPVYGNVYTQLLEYIVAADMVFYGLMIASVFVLRRKAPGVERPYRVWGYPLVPLVYLAVDALLVLDLSYLTPATSGIGYLLVLAGVPVFLIWRKYSVPMPETA